MNTDKKAEPSLPEPLSFVQLDPAHPDAAMLLARLNADLQTLTGSDGSASFDVQDVREPGAAFLVAYRGNQPVACGGFRALGSRTAEIKRVYAQVHGAGAPLLRALETLAAQAGYTRLVCETRRVNARAVAFYLRCGWRETQPYGKYVGRQEAICFEKALSVR
jgi:GNAT superfamily N-acetyltransferase